MSTEIQNEKLLWLLQISRKMLTTRNLQQLLALITDSFVELTQADRGFLFLRDRKTGILVQKAAQTAQGIAIVSSEPHITGIANKVLKQNKSVFSTDMGPANELPEQALLNDIDHKLLVCAPLATESETIGVLCADGAAGFDPSNPTNHRTVELLAEHSAAAVANARMFERATNDPLTGLPNSSYFLLELAKIMQEATSSAPAGILLLDLDSFKRVNNAAGAEVGDQALIDVGMTLQELLRADGFVARYGSDKFAILIPDANSAKIGVCLRDVAERARAAIAAKTYHSIQLSACIGGISLPQERLESAPDAVAMADDLLSAARARGTGEVEIL